MHGVSARLITVTLFIMMIALTIKAQTHFEKELFVNQDDTLFYNLLKPINYYVSLQDGKARIKQKRKYPVILFLHGAGERGSDNVQQIVHIKKLFLDSTNLLNYQAFVVAPQCPKDMKWVEVNWSAQSHKMPKEPSWALNNAMALLQKIIQMYPIDTNRIYITGLSMGGYGVWDMISRYPYKFAAAIPICGGGDEIMADGLKDISIWAFHGSNDKVVPVNRTRNMINTIRQAGGKPKYTEYKGVGHGSWLKAYKEEDLLKWLFEQKLD